MFPLSQTVSPGSHESMPDTALPGMYNLLSLALHSGSKPDNCPMEGKKWKESTVMDYGMKEGRKGERNCIAARISLN